MSHLGDYMDGVPVKISDKYKRPSGFELPYSITECIESAQNVVDTFQLCSTFEENVLSKIKELLRAKETKKNEKNHRLQLLEESKQKKLDALAAAEEEERLKQLSISEVSYPSTEEISTLSPDEKTDKTCDIATNTENTADVTASDSNYPTGSTTNDSHMNLLQPIQVKSNYTEVSLLDDPISNPLENMKLNKVTTCPYSQNIETLTFQDFEQDTSSPFDNIELKTINDMELLAQVLQSHKNTEPYNLQTYSTVQDYSAPDSTQVEEMTYLLKTFVEQPDGTQGVVYTSPQHYPSNGFYIPTDDNNMYVQDYGYYITPNTYPTAHPFYNNQLPSDTVDVQTQNGSVYIPKPHYYEYPHDPGQNQQTAYSLSPESIENDIETKQNIVKSRSRSVPDIVRELNHEIELAKQRVNERSYNPSPTPKTVELPEPSCSVKKKQQKLSHIIEKLPNPYDKLSPSLQEMCQKIHGMGFPLDRVARMCELVGDNDKKMIESLLILGELMDLGFSESKVSAALAKHDLNRDKALDELVS